MRKIMLDTNLLLDYYLGREPGCPKVTKLLGLIYAQDTMPYVSSLSLKDLHYLLSMTLKRMARQNGGGVLSEGDAAAANEIAWTCARQAMERSIIVDIGGAECLRACTYRPLHDDFEDCVQYAAVHDAGIEFLVTGDERALRHAPVACISVDDAIRFLEGGA